jgi:nucleoside-diphosphate-sugar epimerase
MDVLVIGATGFVGGSVARHLATRGHRVTGMARNPAAAELLRGQGLGPLLGNLDDGREPVLAAAARADAVVFAAQPDPHDEERMVAQLLDALAGTGTTFLFTSGSGVLLQRTGGSWSEDSYAEDDPFPVEPLAARRHAVENMVRAATTRDVRGVVLRPGLIWGPNDHGHVSMVYRSVATTGSACYVGEGLNTYSHVHIDDVCDLTERALATGTAGALYHAAAGETPNRWIAQSVAADLERSTRSLDMSEATQVWGELGALIMGASSRTRAPRARRELGWAPRHTDLLTTIGEPRLRALATTR